MKYLAMAAILLAYAQVAWSQEQTINGKLEIARDQFVIVTKNPISGTSDFDDSVVSSRRIMLTGYTQNQADALKKLVGQNVSATGILGQAFSPYHTEPLVLVIEKLPTVAVTGRGTNSSATATTPAPGSKLRTALMDAIRADDFYPDRAAAKANSRNILFKVNFLKVNGQSALANVIPLSNGTEFADPRWCLLQQNTAGEWVVLDYLKIISKYYKDDADFFSALDMDKRAVAYLRKELPQVSGNIFP